MHISPALYYKVFSNHGCLQSYKSPTVHMDSLVAEVFGYLGTCLPYNPANGI